jgi:hypothetical protein
MAVAAGTLPTPSRSVKTVRQVMYGLDHAKSGVSPKTRTFSLMFV